MPTQKDEQTSKMGFYFSTFFGGREVISLAHTCKEHGIRLSGPPLGRRKNTVTDAAAEKQIYKDACAKTEAALDILAMNAAYRLRLWLIRFLVRIRILAVFQQALIIR
ncbi:MAG: hypothetical protein LUD69_02140 [Oscillospiraceae bacterium]|nr:hypothetical protein [Oscillospiraceae bacterium]